MAKVVAINPLMVKGYKPFELYRNPGKKSIDLETVRSIASKKGLDAKILRAWPVFDNAIQEEDTPVHAITFEYKIHCDAEVFYVEENEFNRLEDVLAQHGWYI